MTKLRISQTWASLSELRQAGVEELAVDHWGEVGEDKDALPLDIDWAMLRRMERAGQIRALGLFADDELAGYLVFELVAPRLSRRATAALELGLYVVPAHRGLWAIRLVLAAESLLRAEGVSVSSISSRPGAPGVGDLLAKLGYRPTEVIHTKVL